MLHIGSLTLVDLDQNRDKLMEKYMQSQKTGEDVSGFPVNLGEKA